MNRYSPAAKRIALPHEVHLGEPYSHSPRTMRSRRTAFTQSRRTLCRISSGDDSGIFVRRGKTQARICPDRKPAVLSLPIDSHHLPVPNQSRSTRWVPKRWELHLESHVRPPRKSEG